MEEALCYKLIFTFYTVINTVQTALHCFNSIMYAYISIVREG